jgi:hypothetical protein
MVGRPADLRSRCTLNKECSMKLVRLVVSALLAGAAAAFVASLLRPRRPGGYDPWQMLPTGTPVPPRSAG